MNIFDWIVSVHARAVSTAANAIVSGWFALIFVVSLGGLLAGA